MILSRDLKKQKVGHHPPSTIHHPNKKKISGVESEILIKYKRIKWTPIGKASLLSSQGDNFLPTSHSTHFTHYTLHIQTAYLFLTYYTKHTFYTLHITQ